MESLNIYKKLALVKTKIGKISKDSTNPFYKSKYFDVNSLLEHVELLLSENGLLLLQPIEHGSVTTQIINPEDGEMVFSSIKLPELSDPQKLGGAITYFRRYTLQSLLALQAEDDDGNNAEKPPKQPGQRTVTDWLSETQFKKALESDRKGITATISAYTSAPKGMKKEYLTQLTEKLKTL